MELIQKVGISRKDMIYELVKSEHWSRFKGCEESGVKARLWWPIDTDWLREHVKREKIESGMWYGVWHTGMVREFCIQYTGIT